MVDLTSQDMVLALIAKHVIDPISTVVDVGAGTGKYADALKPLAIGAHFIGIEKWAPNINHFALHAAYKKVIVADAAWLAWDRLVIEDSARTLVVFGNVFGKMQPHDALLTWVTARRYAKYAVMTVPVVPHPPDEQFGNPYNSEITHWDHTGVLESFPGIVDFQQAPIYGAYMAVGEKGDY